MPHGIFIFYAFLAVAAILIARQLFHLILPRLAHIKTPKNSREKILVRYQHKDFGAWMFAWFKTGLDPMFNELPEFLKPLPEIKSFLDLGCGFGIAGCFLLDYFENAIAYAIDPTLHRVNGAAAAMGTRGKVFQGSAPNFELPQLPTHFDAIFALDMIHFLSDADLELTLTRLRSKLKDGQHLFIRSPIRPDGPMPLRRRSSYIFSKLTGTFSTLRTVDQVQQKISTAYFQITTCQPSGKKPDLVWFIATASPVPQPHDNPTDPPQHNHRVNHNHRSPMPSGELV